MSGHELSLIDIDEPYTSPPALPTSPFTQPPAAHRHMSVHPTSSDDTITLESLASQQASLFNLVRSLADRIAPPSAPVALPPSPSKPFPATPSSLGLFPSHEPSPLRPAALLPFPSISPTPSVSISSTHHIPSKLSISFSGDRASARDFIQQLDRTIRLHSASFAGDSQNCALWASVHLTGAAAAWYTGLETSASPYLVTWGAFTAAFLEAWAPADERRQIVVRFFALRHTSSVAEYNSTFFSLAQQAGYEDGPILKDLYVVHLKPEVFKALEQEQRVMERMGSKYVTTRELSIVAEKIDVAIRSSSTTTPTAPHPAPSAKPKTAYANAVKSTLAVALPPPSPSLLSLSLADISPAAPTETASRPPRPSGPIPTPPHGSGPRPRGSVTQAEREYRWKWWLCMYCADPGHQEEMCPILLARKAGN